MPASSELTDPVLKQLPRRAIARPDLERRLDDVAPGGLGMLVASAGSGKSVLVRQWYTARPHLRVASLALTRRHDDAVVLARDLVHMVLSVASPSDLALGQLVTTGGSSLGDALVDGLLASLAVLPEDVVLVFDDVHALTSHPVVEDLGRLLTSLPSTTRAVVTTRRDLPWSLHRLRLDDRVVEIRGAELAFDELHGHALLEGVSQRELAEDLAATLVHRTDGWAAGLQLAAISLRTVPDPAVFVESFAGSDHLVAEYLLNEVIERQEPDVRRFLLQTSMLEWLSAELCDVVTGLDTSGALLDELYRRSMFLIPLDAAGRAFRYHHLFAEVLYFRLRIEDPESVDELHHRAAAWLLQHGRDEEGVAQLLAAGDTREAFTVISAAGHRLFESGQSATLVRWLSTIVQAPQSPAAVEVNLLAAQLGADDATGAAETHRRICRRADLTLGERTAANALYASLAIRGLPPETVLNITDEVREALPALGPDDVVDFLGIGGRDSVELISEYSTGLAHFFKGDLDRAAATLGHVRTLPGMKYPLWTAYVLGSLALVRAWQGHSREAAGLADSAIKEARSFGTDLHHATTHAHQALALTHLDHMELDAAELDLAGATLAMRGRTASGTFVDLQLALRVRLLVAREGPVAALKLLRAPAATGAEAPVLWGARQALRIQLLGAVGDLAGARALLRDDRPNPQMPPVHIDLALATGDIPAARAALEQWRPAADDTRNLVRRLLREFVVLTAEGSSRAAKASLTEAVGVARGNRLRSPFLEVPSALRAVRQGVGHGAWLKDDALWQVAGRLEPLVHAQGKLIEPLTGRELAVLAYLPGRMKNLEIAADLFVSVNTIKTQIGSIYRKLGVTERNEAVARAQRLGLL